MSLLPPRIVELARGAWVGLDLDTTGGQVGEDAVLEVGIAVAGPTWAERWSGRVYVDPALLGEGVANGYLDPMTLAIELQALARIARGFVADNAFASAARFLSGWPWKLWGPWYDVRARFRATWPAAWAPSMGAMCDALRLPRMTLPDDVGFGAVDALQVWLCMEREAPLPGVA